MCMKLSLEIEKMEYYLDYDNKTNYKPFTHIEKIKRVLKVCKSHKYAYFSSSTLEFFYW